jgi:hypothetical protein
MTRHCRDYGRTHRRTLVTGMLPPVASERFVEGERGRLEVVSHVINGRRVTVQQRRKNFAISV